MRTWTRRQDVAERFWAKVSNVDGPLACWTWTGAFSQKSRGRPHRPVFWVGRLVAPGELHAGAPQLLVPAARMALMLTDGVCLDERQGLEARHRCANPACVNPAHLIWGTPDENIDDRYVPAAVERLRERLGTI